MSAPQNKSVPGLASRRAASLMLDDVLTRNRPLDAVQAERGEFVALSPSDRAFVILMIKTALRRHGQISALLEAWLERPLPAKLSPVECTLRLGIAQLLWLEVPPHAAVHASVELMKQSGYSGQAGMVNAILNRAVREGAGLIASQDAARMNTPDWLWDAWVRTHGEETARAIAAAHLTEPPLDISVQADATAWAEKLGARLLPGGTLRLSQAGNITELPGFAEGAWWVQGANAAVPARLLEQAAGPLAGKQVLDLCAAPGGKTAQLAAMGARVTAVDIAEKRLRVLKENLKRLKLEASVVIADAAAYTPASPVHAILLDAPCSATGTLRRHPDVARHRTQGDIDRLCATQMRLLGHALSLLPEGGILVYAVCSLQEEEGAGQIARLCAANGNVKLRESHVLLPGGAGDDGDGFFVAVLEKR